jgi:hypothetical protein
MTATRQMIRTSTCLIVLAAAGQAAAQPVSLQVDPARSSVDISITLNTPVGNRTDNDSSPVTGFVYLGADNYASPASLVLYDASFTLSNTLNFNWSFGFAGSADATLTDGGIFAANPGVPAGPVPVTAGTFTTPEVLLQAAGVANTNYDILFVGTDSVIVDLGAEGPLPASLGGNISLTEGIIEVTTSSTLTDTFVVIEGLVTADVTTTATIVATAPLPACPADVAAPFGSLNFFDVSAFINAFVAQDPSADFRVDGVFNFFDVSEYISAFSAGCP